MGEEEFVSARRFWNQSDPVDREVGPWKRNSSVLKWGAVQRLRRLDLAASQATLDICLNIASHCRPVDNLLESVESGLVAPVATSGRVVGMGQHDPPMVRWNDPAGRSLAILSVGQQTSVEFKLWKFFMESTTLFGLSCGSLWHESRRGVEQAQVVVEILADGGLLRPRCQERVRS